MKSLNTALCPALLSDSLYNKKLIIPIYQRLFVWEEEQIKTLLDDLITALAKSGPYYIGAITVVEKNNQWEIVDGQQRLTFLTLFGCECVRRGWFADEWKSFIFFNDESSVEETSPLRIQYFARKDDEADIAILMEQSPSESDVTIKNRNFRLFHDCFELLVKKSEEQESEEQESEEQKAEEQVDIKKFAEYVHQNASFLISALPSTYTPLDLNLFFEKMNAAGRQLEPVDIVKGKYFSADASIWNRCMNFDCEYEKGTSNDNGAADLKSQSILDVINEEQHEAVEEQSDSKEVSSTRLVLKPAVFLLHVLRIATQNCKISLDSSKLIQSFETEKDFSTVFIEKMMIYRKWVDANIVFLEREADGSYQYLFRNQIKEEGDQELDNRKMKQFQSMLYVSSSDSQEWVLDAFRECGNGEKQLDLKTLKKIDNKKHPFNAEDSKKWRYWNINRYWFWKLDYVLWENSERQSNSDGVFNKEDFEAIKNYVFQRNYSIEHLHPQSSSDPWGDDDLHGFGNLALISAGFNLQQSNDSVGTKFGRMTDKINEGKLESIKLLLMFKKAEGVDKNWKMEVAKEHGEEMHGILRDYYRNNG